MIGVITADIIDSSQLSAKRKIELNQWIEEEVTSYQAYNLFAQQPVFFYRGDSFQIALNEAQYCLDLCLRLRSKTRATAEAGEDIRLAIGLGSVQHLDKTIALSDGEAFRYSGRAFEKLKDHRLKVQSINAHWDSHLNTSFALLDVLISKWSHEMAEATYYSLYGLTQKDIAQKLNISQPAIHNRLINAGYSSIKQLLHHYQQAVPWLNPSS